MSSTRSFESAVTVPSIYPESNRTAWITARRSGRAPLDPWKPNGFFLELERSKTGELTNSGVILLTNKECPWHCLMCDLWKQTLQEPVPIGAIPHQIELALSAFVPRPQQVKLYNSGSFFDPGAIPLRDYEPIARSLSFAEHVIVESHPRLIGEKCLRLRDLLSGTLEVAMGLETVHPEILPKLNKKFSLEQFADAAAFLRREGIDMRAFVLVKPPFLDEDGAVEFAVQSAEFAFSCGAGVVSLIPTRPGNGALDDLMAAGEFRPPSIQGLERSLELGLQLNAGRVFADTWELGQFCSCSACREARVERLTQMNLTQRMLPPVVCSVCSPKN